MQASELTSKLAQEGLLEDSDVQSSTAPLSELEEKDLLSEFIEPHLLRKVNPAKDYS